MWCPRKDSNLRHAEHQFLEGQRKMQQKATDERLRTMILEHIGQTEQHIKNLEQVFGILGEQPKRQPCSGAKGLIEEATKVMQEADGDELRDSLIGGAAAKAEHYEMVSHADLITGSEMMGKQRVTTLLRANREQEVRTARRMERAAPRLLKRAASAERGPGRAR